ncbi:transmembrane protein 69-like [Acanthaster planci]|uniref:Transmembrane protein 69-like n=1 Tax=Acanthaster planci TaxID=133434 RepID=A0A8B7Z1E1_ACAPL|nr:transmembrane protein 69-like [Acanthaster planci]XP_022097226.1 transmembrane protein 69-like [Acanthaster planci]XP_022097227.1 transmembrane protein 69-like [Acanthaster planci]XP_022097229.1 transmembrane protein 69-like [Acanthaster planci]XP_022097230.1 transmembrane protein 69-like [Acanthaster planci]
MSRLLRCLQGGGTFRDAVTVTKPIFNEAYPWRFFSGCCSRSDRRESQKSSAVVWKSGLGVSLKYPASCQATCLRRSRTGLEFQNLAGFQAGSTVCLHTSGHLNGRVSNLLRRHQQGLRDTPIPALTLGLSGLIPFVAPTLYTAATFSVAPNILWAQVAYGASILSFLGGVRWGFALLERQDVGPTWSMLGYSIMPSLIAWLGLLMPLQASQICIMTGLLMAWAADMSIKVYPAWFRSLRLTLSLVALLSLGVSYGFCLVYEPTSETHGSNVMKLIKIVQIILED